MNLNWLTDFAKKVFFSIGLEEIRDDAKTVHVNVLFFWVSHIVSNFISLRKVNETEPLQFTGFCPNSPFLDRREKGSHRRCLKLRWFLLFPFTLSSEWGMAQTVLEWRISHGISTYHSSDVNLLNWPLKPSLNNILAYSNFVCH